METVPQYGSSEMLHVACRYVFDPVDIEAEMEVTARVRKAAAEALMEAQEKLKAAEEAQEQLKEQLEQYKDLAKVHGDFENIVGAMCLFVVHPALFS